MSKELLPKGILSRALKVSGEYAWKSKDITNVLNSATETGLACLGGEIWIVKEDQFEDYDPIYKGVYELYDLSFGPELTLMEKEPWSLFVKRSCSETLDKFKHFEQFVQPIRITGEDIEFLWINLSLVTEQEYWSLEDHLNDLE